MLTDLDALLPPGVEREAGPPPRPPETFEEGYVLPVHSDKPLQQLHRHSHDEVLRFYEEDHIYTYRGVPTSTSVTTLAHEHEGEFDPDAAITTMETSRSQAWPRKEYVLDPQPADAATWATHRGALLAANGKTIAAVQPHSFSPSTSLADVRRVLLAGRVRAGGADVAEADMELFTFARAETRDETKAKWKRKGMISSHEGTHAHWLCECALNGMPVCWWEREMAAFHEFARTHLLPRGIVAYNTEKEIVCPDADLAGSIDCILYEPATGLHHIVDWKRSDKLQSQLRGYSKMQPPLQHLDDCKGASYALQTSIYQSVLEREYGMKIGERILVSIHPDKPFVTAVPYLEAESRYLMESRFALVRARRAARDHDPAGFTCALTGAPLVDAVRLADGRLAMEKAALVAGEAHEPAPEIRAAFADAVAARLERVPPPGAATCTSWRRRMPAEGLVPFA